MDDNKADDQDYSKVCRTCLQSNVEMQNLTTLINDNYGAGEVQVTYLECLRFCLPVQEAGVDMPQKICIDCASALQVAYWFTKNALKAQELLRTRLKELQEKRRQLERQAFAESLKKPKRYRCKICNVRLETKRSLKDHVKLHLDIIVYSCQMCPYENHKRNYLIEHYQLVHGLEATPDQLKPKTKTGNNNSNNSNNTSIINSKTSGQTITNIGAGGSRSNSMSNQYTQNSIQNQNIMETVHHNPHQQQQQQHQTFVNATSHIIPEVFNSSQTLQQNSEYIYTTTTDVNNLSQAISLPLEGNGNNAADAQTTTIFTQPMGETLTFNTFDGAEINVQNDLNVGNEFVVMADGTVQDAMGRGVVILQSSEDGTISLPNGLLLENIIQVPNAETANIMVSQNDVVQMEVDDMIVEEPQTSPDQEVPLPLDEDMIPATIIKKVSCKICTKDFDSQGELKNHMLTHSDIPHFFCEYCSFYTFFKIDLHQHYKSKHNLQPTNKQLQPRNRQRAATGSLGAEVDSQRKNVVVQRIERCAKSSRLVYYCDICFFECDLKYEIKRHYSTKHKIQATEVHQRVSKSSGDSFNQIQPKVIDQRNIQRQAEQNGPPDYENGLNCRKCNEVFYWRNELYEHYKLHNAEEMALKNQKIQQKIIANNPIVKATPLSSEGQELLPTPTPVLDFQQESLEPIQQNPNQIHEAITEPSEQQQQSSNQILENITDSTDHQVELPPQVLSVLSTHSQFTDNNMITTTTTAVATLDTPLQTFDNVDTMSLGFATNQSVNNPAPLTPSSSSTYTLPSDAIPQIVEMEQTIETDMDFDFNGDALFEDFDDVDVENESEDNNDERNIALTSDDDYEDMNDKQNEKEEQKMQQQQQEQQNSEQQNPEQIPEPQIGIVDPKAQRQSYCAQCQKSFNSHYQFENHMFLHRGLAPYRCEMCTNLYNTKRALIRHYKAIHKKVPTRDMIQAKGDKVYIYDKTPMDYLNIEESKFITLMCAKCTYESIDYASVQLHLNTNHSIHDDSYILRKLPFECPRCIRSFATKPRLLCHLERNHSTTPINLHQVQRNLTNTVTTTTTTTTAPSLYNNVNMMNEMNAECGKVYQVNNNNNNNSNNTNTNTNNCTSIDNTINTTTAIAETSNSFLTNNLTTKNFANNVNNNHIENQNIN